MTLDREQLFEPRLPEEDVEVPGFAGTVRVRGLSRIEAMKVQNAGDVVDMDRMIIHLGLVDPVMSLDDVRRWQKAATAGELEPVTDAIARLSGMAEGQGKETYLAFRGGSESGVRALPGDQAVDDGGGATSVPVE